MSPKSDYAGAFTTCSKHFIYFVGTYPASNICRLWTRRRRERKWPGCSERPDQPGWPSGAFSNLGPVFISSVNDCDYISVSITDPFYQSFTDYMLIRFGVNMIWACRLFDAGIPDGLRQVTVPFAMLRDVLAAPQRIWAAGPHDARHQRLIDVLHRLSPSSRSIFTRRCHLLTGLIRQCVAGLVLPRHDSFLMLTRFDPPS